MNTTKNLKELNREIRLSNTRLVLKWVAGIALVCFAFAGYEAVTTPTSYGDCLLSEVKGAQNDIAAMAIQQSCSGRFPGPAIHTPLPWYRHPFSHYRDSNECVIKETGGISDPPEMINGAVQQSARIQLLAVACFQLF